MTDILFTNANAVARAVPTGTPITIDNVVIFSELLGTTVCAVVNVLDGAVGRNPILTRVLLSITYLADALGGDCSLLTSTSL